ncbi:MAG TPA: hypothetical protein VNZ52_02585 [Candidatus Thermoplasmatota archaeon]|nr:hypothetical protein [Candidatus Thermoplasmatota archaeon]
MSRIVERQPEGTATYRPGRLVWGVLLALVTVAAAFLVLSGGAAAQAPGPSDLSLTKTDSVDPATVGENLTYTIAVRNNGPNRQTGVTVTDTIPSGATILNATSSTGTCTVTGQTVTCNVGGLASGATATVTIIVVPTSPGTLSNTASVSAGQADTNSANNADTETTTVRTPPPATIECRTSGTSIVVEWSAVSGATSYNVYRATGSGPFTFLANTPTNNYTDAAVTVGETYRYMVRAVSAGGESVDSPICTVTAIPFFTTILVVGVALIGSLAIFLGLRHRRNRGGA